MLFRSLSLKVSDLCDYQAWNWDLIPFNLPQIIKDKIKAIPIQMYGNGGGYGDVEMFQ